MKFLHRRPTDSEGFAITDAVSAKLQKEGADRLVLLRNGVNLFRFNPRGYCRISVHKAEQGVYHLLGYATVQSEAGTVLASFPTARGAENAHCAVSAAYAGLGTNRKVLKWGLIVVATYAVLSLLFGAPKAAQVFQNGAPKPALEGFSANEPSLEELAAGGYQFRPKIAAPAVQAPDLTCPGK
jgi:hypothetical protein